MPNLQVQPLQSQGTFTGVSTLPQQPSLNMTQSTQPQLSTEQPKQPALSYVGTLAPATGLNQPQFNQNTAQIAPLSGDVKTKMIKLLTDAQSKYPGQEDQILQRFMADNQSQYPAQMGKIQSFLGSPLNGGSRTDRNNNPIAAAVKTNGQNEITKALDKSGIQWDYGDAFPGNSDMSTIKILGDPTQAAKTILASTSTIQSWYNTHTGKQVLSQYGIKNNTDFANADPMTQKAVVEGIYNAENGTKGQSLPSGYDAKTVLKSLIADNQSKQNNNQVIPDRSGNFLQRVGQDFQGIGQNLNNNLLLEQQGKEGSVSSWLQTLGAGAEGVNSLIGEGITSLWRTLAPQYTQAGLAAWGDLAGKIPGVKQSLGGVQTALSSFQQAHPVGAANLGALTNIAMAVAQFIPGSQEASAVEKATGAYEDALGATKTGIQTSSKVLARSGESPSEFLANAGILPETEEINGRRVFTTGPDSQTYQTIQQRASDLTKLRDNAISKAGQGMLSSLEDTRQTALKEAETSFSGTSRQKMLDHINTEFDAYKKQYAQGRYTTLDDMTTIKKDLQSKSGYDATRPTETTQANQIMADAAKTQIEKDAEQAGIPGIKQMNKYIQQHLDFLDKGNKKGILSKLNGQVVKGGKLGVYAKEIVGGTIGTVVGKTLGGGLMGEIGGGIAGAYGGKLVASLMQKFAVGGTKIAGIMGRMATENPEVVETFLRYLGRSGEKIAPMVKPSLKLGTRNALGSLGALGQTLLPTNQTSTK